MGKTTNFALLLTPGFSRITLFVQAADTTLQPWFYPMQNSFETRLILNRMQHLLAAFYHTPACLGFSPSRVYSPTENNHNNQSK